MKWDIQTITTQPGAKEPQVALDGQGHISIVFGIDQNLYITQSSDAGTTFGAPRPIASAGILSLGMRRGPRIAYSGKTLVISAVFGKQGGGKDGELVAWRSPDGGKNWKGPILVSDIPGAAREGLHGMASGPDGTLACAWLDLRDKGTRLYLAQSRDGGATWSKNSELYRSPSGTICECCHPSVAFDSKGRLLVMFRNALNGARDMYLMRSSDSGKTFSSARKLGNGVWMLDACPMDGGAVCITSTGQVTTFWRRSRTLYACVEGEPEIPVGDGQQGWVAAGNAGPYYAWLSRRPGPLMVLTPGDTAPRILADNADDPVVAASPDGKTVFAAWTVDGKGIQAAKISPIAKGDRK